MTTKKADYGLKLTGVVRVFRKDKDIEDKKKKVKFTVSDVWFNTSEKDEEGNWFNISTNLIFKRGIEPPLNNSVIEIIEAFPMINGKGQYKKVVYYVKGWHYAQGHQQPQQGQQQQPNQQQYQQQGGQPNNGYQQAPNQQYQQQGGQQYQQQPNGYNGQQPNHYNGQ